MWWIVHSSKFLPLSSTSLKNLGIYFHRTIFPRLSAQGAYSQKRFLGGVLNRGRALVKKINFLTNMFLKSNKDNGIIAEVIGGRKRENGLVVPCLYKCRSKNKIIAEILINSSEKYQHMDIIYINKNILF